MEKFSAEAAAMNDVPTSGEGLSEWQSQVEKKPSLELAASSSASAAEVKMELGSTPVNVGAAATVKMRGGGTKRPKV